MREASLSSLRVVILLFATWRAVLFFVAYISPNFIPEFGARFPYSAERLIASGLPYWIWSFGNFDGVHYLGIAKAGYFDQFTQVFFPLYPLLIRLVSIFTVGNLLVAGLLISNIAFLFGLIIFYRLILRIYNKEVAFWSSLFLIAFPTSFFFGSIYTEGLFFLMIIASFYLLEQGKILQASVIGAFASATRLVGLFLVPAMTLKASFKSFIPFLIAPIGFIAYVIYLQIEFNEPLYFLNAQGIFGQERSTTGIVFLPQVFWRYFKILTTTSGLPFVNATFELVSTIFAIVLLAIGFKKIKREWWIFSALSILLPTLTGTLASMPRYILVAFPIFIVLAQIKNIKIKIFIFISFAAGLALSTVFFTRGFWVA